MGTTKTQVVKLDGVVVERKLPMTQEGSDALRAIRKHMEDSIAKATGEIVILPLPTVIHMVLLDYKKMNSIEDWDNVEDNQIHRHS